MKPHAPTGIPLPSVETTRESQKHPTAAPPEHAAVPPPPNLRSTPPNLRFTPPPIPSRPSMFLEEDATSDEDSDLERTEDDEVQVDEVPEGVDRALRPQASVPLPPRIVPPPPILEREATDTSSVRGKPGSAEVTEVTEVTEATEVTDVADENLWVVDEREARDEPMTRDQQDLEDAFDISAGEWETPSMRMRRHARRLSELFGRGRRADEKKTG